MDTTGVVGEVESVSTGEGVRVFVGRGEGVSVGGTGEAVKVWVRLGVKVEDGMGVTELVCVCVTVGVENGVNVPDGVKVTVVDGVILAVKVI